MISLSSGDRKAISASSKASTASQSSASADEDGMRSGGRPRVATADTHSRPGRAMVRRPMGVPLSSPKQPQPASGRRCLISFSAHRDEEERRRPGPDDGGGQRGPVAAELHGRADQPEAQAEPEIAAVLGISLGTVKSTVSRAVAKLRIDAELGEDSGA
jgi:hypothetical protein